MKSVFGNRPLLLSIFLSLLLAAASFAVLSRFPHEQIVPCTDRWADNLLLTLTLVFVLQVFLAPKILPNHFKAFLAVHAVLIVFILWLGSYSISPLGYSNGRIPNLRGFLVIRSQRRSIIAHNEIVSLKQGSAVAISPLMLAGKFRCDWMSMAGGELDDSSSCDTIYIPPSADYDILRVRVRSSCGLPGTVGQIKVSILP